MIEPTRGSLVLHSGRQLLFHSSTKEYFQYEDLESGEIQKWKREAFYKEALSGDIRSVATQSTSTQIIVRPAEGAGRATQLVGLTPFEQAEQARAAYFLGVFITSGLRLPGDENRVTELIAKAATDSEFDPISLWKLRRLIGSYRRTRERLLACTPERRGARAGSVTVHTKDEELAQLAIDNHYLKLERPSAAAAHVHYLRRTTRRSMGRCQRIRCPSGRSSVAS